MSRLLLLITVIWMTGCATAEYRTGSVAIHPLDISRFERGGAPPYLALQIRKGYDIELRSYLRANGKLTFGSNCRDSDFQLSSDLTEMRIRRAGFVGTGYGGINASLKVGIKGRLIDCRTGATLIRYDVDDSDSDLADLMQDLTKSISEEIIWNNK